MFKLAGLLLAATLVAAAVPGATAEDLKITEVRAPVLMLWADNEGSSLVAEIPKGNVKTPLKVLRVSENLMLKVIIDKELVNRDKDLEAWVFGHHVKTNSPVKMTAECDPNVSKAEVGAVRGLGEGCQ